MKLVKETCKDNKLSFSSVICRINTTNSHRDNYCKQQNVGFIDNRNIKKSDFNSEGLHLYEYGSSKLAKSLLDFIYWICKQGSSVSYEPKVCDNCVNNAAMLLKTNHPQCVSLEYLNINFVWNKFHIIPPLI